MNDPKDTTTRDQERVDQLRLALRDWRPPEQAPPWMRPEHRDRRLVIRRAA